MNAAQNSLNRCTYSIWVTKFSKPSEKKWNAASIFYFVRIETDWKSTLLSICLQDAFNFSFSLLIHRKKRNAKWNKMSYNRRLHAVMDVLEHLVSLHSTTGVCQHKNSHHLISGGNLAKHIPSLSNRHRETQGHCTSCTFASTQCARYHFCAEWFSNRKPMHFYC